MWGMPWETDWRAAARCRTADAEALFIGGARQRITRRFCRPCPVRLECLAYALDERIEYGVWGGLTERQRRALLKAHPRVPSWRAALRRTAHRRRQIRPG